MNQKRLFLLIICCFLNIALLCAQEFVPYFYASLEEYIGKFVKEKVGGGRISIWGHHLLIITIEVQSHPVPLQDEYSSEIKQTFSDELGYSELYGNDFFVNTYGHYFSQIVNDIDCVFFVQNQLVEHFRKELRPGNRAELYIMFGLYNDFDDTLYVFVNEFRTQGGQVHIEIETPKWVHGTWVEMMFGESELVLGPEYIGFTGDIPQSLIQTLGDPDPLLPDEIKRRISGGRYYAIKITPDYHCGYGSVYVFNHPYDPFPQLRCQGPPVPLKQGGEYLRRIHLFQMNWGGIMQWVYTMKYYQKF